ncbi:VQ motif-containing protein [Euphorbia peplus]|nr:VQ motif-containing protein [Euphorbia peplus]
MEDHMMMLMRNKQTPSSSNSSSSLALNIHKDSHEISKVKPKIRIIHIFAPEIIKTDVENFRELVQRLTGKPSPSDRGHQRSSKKSRIPRKQQPRIHFDDQKNKKAAQEIVKSGEMVQIKEEDHEEMWNMNNSNLSGGFLSGFADLDGFIQQLDDFSMMHSIGANQIFAGFGETQLA